MIDLIEFHNGSKVTYKPYETAIPALVKEVRKNPINGEITYKLVTRPGADAGVNAITTGRSIVESSLFEEHGEEDDS